MRISQALAFPEAPQLAAGLIDRLRTRAPRVHCITNTVAQNFTANVLLATGCIPSMTLSPDEVGSFVAQSAGLLVNLGTLDAERRQAINTAIGAATAQGIPWVLDPVFVDRSPARAGFARSLLARKPTAIRLNHAEFQTLASSAPERDAVFAFARAQGGVVALSGKTDLVSDGERVLHIENGHPLMARVTAIGCASSALLTACLAVHEDPFVASAAALMLLGLAGELAAQNAKGPGTFAAHLLDALYALDAPTVVARARIA